MPSLVFATNNPNKIKEISLQLSADFHIKNLIDIGCNEELPETHHTIEENSAEKATFVAKKFRVDCFSEDTGLEVEALNGEPGVDSAHYAGDRDANKNMDKLLKKLETVENRNAQFKTVITLIYKEVQYQFVGILKGKIGKEKKGNYGFGYDPIFVLADGRTMAELMIDEKVQISHRAIATKKLIDFLSNLD